VDQQLHDVVVEMTDRHGTEVVHADITTWVTPNTPLS
jgi:hypothetical protein